MFCISSKPGIKDCNRDRNYANNLTERSIWEEISWKRIKERGIAREPSRAHRATLRAHLGNFGGVFKQIAPLTESRKKLLSCVIGCNGSSFVSLSISDKASPVRHWFWLDTYRVTALNDTSWVTGQTQQDFSVASRMRLSYTHRITHSRNADRGARHKKQLAHTI